MKLKELRERTYRQVLEYIVHNPQVTYKEVGEKFGISGVQAGLLARKAGFAPRRKGRKSRAGV
jgi:hypothetical protein